MVLIRPIRRGDRFWELISESVMMDPVNALRPPDDKSKMNSNRRNIKAGKQPKKITETYLHNAGFHYLHPLAVTSGHSKEVMRRKTYLSCPLPPDQNKTECYA